MNNKLTKKDFQFLNNRFENDIYQQTDNRVLESYIEDIDDENNFESFCEEFFELLDEENYWD